jgi:hypothetical protein
MMIAIAMYNNVSITFSDPERLGYLEQEYDDVPEEKHAGDIKR